MTSLPQAAKRCFMAFVFTFKRRLKIKFDFGGAEGFQRGAGVCPPLAAVASATTLLPLTQKSRLYSLTNTNKDQHQNLQFLPWKYPFNLLV